MVLIFTKGRVDPRAVVRSEGNMSLKNPVTSPGTDPGTVRLVAQRLNHYATPGPQIYSRQNLKFLSVGHKAEKTKFVFKGLNAKITLMSLDNQVNAGTFWKEHWTQNNETAAKSLLVTFFEYV